MSAKPHHAQARLTDKAPIDRSTSKGRDLGPTLGEMTSRSPAERWCTLHKVRQGQHAHRPSPRSRDQVHCRTTHWVAVPYGLTGAPQP
jgi:hypothetical protein